MKNIPQILLQSPPVHPGEDLAEMLADFGLSGNALAKRLGVPANRITTIVKGQRDITPDTAFRLATFFGMSAQYWMNLQQLYELAKTYQARKAEFDKIQPMEFA